MKIARAFETAFSGTVGRADVNYVDLLTTLFEQIAKTITEYEPLVETHCGTVLCVLCVLYVCVRKIMHMFARLYVCKCV